MPQAARRFSPEFHEPTPPSRRLQSLPERGGERRVRFAFQHPPVASVEDRRILARRIQELERRLSSESAPPRVLVMDSRKFAELFWDEA